MSTSQRVTRGFHRLAVSLAAIPLLVGVTLSLFYAGEPTYKDLQQYKFLVCAHEHFERVTTPKRESAALPSIEQEAERDWAERTDLGDLTLPSIGKETKPDRSLENNPFHLLFAPNETRLNLSRMGAQIRITKPSVSEKRALTP